ncbi:SOS response-associated peptidase [Paraburkholderia gardini]|uniref:SOS response-associated peptidase n=1 Tax=Paraburkholderia gardini TaxID=2823469 RepID=UPI001E138700|nr:SOS response-associated peptidase family protein [Paraburkholderia gardini]CAG4923307.1 hypothetical protein R69919_05089 [Paraburkholderia gardini]
MCTNYRPTSREQFAGFSDFLEPLFEYPAETYKDYLAPILRLDNGTPSTDGATFAMVPRRRIPPGVKVFDTMNARAETVDEKRSYSGAWKRQQLCLIPCECVFEPSYETGKPVRWRIEMASRRPFAIAGLWRAWEDPDGISLSMTMLTVNADGHPLMKRFHRPGDEKRSVVIIRPEDYLGWLGSKSADEARSFLKLYPADEMFAEAAPKPPRSKPTDGSQGALLT